MRGKKENGGEEMVWGKRRERKGKEACSPTSYFAFSPLCVFRGMWVPKVVTLWVAWT